MRARGHRLGHPLPISNTRRFHPYGRAGGLRPLILLPTLT